MLIRYIEISCSTTHTFQCWLLNSYCFRIRKQYEFRSQHWKVWVVLQDISIYRINIECEPKTDYEQCLNQHQITSKIDIEWRNRQRSVWLLRYWITFWWNLCKNCSFFFQFWGIFWWYYWNVRTKPIISKIEFEKADIKSNFKSWNCAALGVSLDCFTLYWRANIDYFLWLWYNCKWVTRKFCIFF